MNVGIGRGTGTGRAGARPRRVSVKDVAVAAGVSVGTVSNVLNRPDRVTAANRRRVEEAMRELRFVRNESARQLRAMRSSTVAYVMLDAGNPFFTDVAKGMEQAAEIRDLAVFLCDSDNSPEREHTHLRRLAQHRVQGVLITPTDANHPLLDEVADQGIPLVIVDRVREDRSLCSVAVDDHLGGRLAAEHLLDRGHRRIAFVGGPASLGQVHDRHHGAAVAIRGAGLSPSSLTVVTIPALTIAAGRNAGERLAGIPRAKRPTAAFCANDLVALGLLQQYVTLGMRVPNDLAIVGYDDIEFAAAAAVPLTSVRQPRFELGRTAAELLLDEATNPAHEHTQIQFEPELVARASTATPT